MTKDKKKKIVEIKESFIHAATKKTFVLQRIDYTVNFEFK